MKLRHWPHEQVLAVRDLCSPQALTVICMEMPQRPARELARQQIRTAVRETIAACVKVPTAEVLLHSIPGQPESLQAPYDHIGVSISHEDGISVAALHLKGSVGVDLVRVDRAPLPDWEQVALDYLGPAALQRVAQLSGEQRAVAFAQAWSEHEAQLKCLGIALTEWTPALASRLSQCKVTAIALSSELPTDLPSALCGAVALLGAAA